MAELAVSSRLLLTTVLLSLAIWDGVWVSGENPLNVTVFVDYTPPPDAAGLGPHEYWAASGPLNATCVTTGTTGPVTYQWSSNCDGCYFTFNNSQSVIVPVISSGYTGKSRCLATDTPTGTTNNKSIEIVVIGAGLIVALGDNSIRYIQNNSLAYSDSSSITCYSGSRAEENVGEFIGVNGDIISGSTVTHPHRGSVSLSIHTSDDQGIYTCRIPDETRVSREVNFGLYHNGFNIAPTIGTELVFTNGSSSSTLTCTSTGSPATTVTWMRDGQPLTIDGTTYQLTQTVTSRQKSTYKNVLTITDELANIIDHMYTCNVSNILGSASRDIYVGDPLSPVPISPTTFSPTTSPTQTDTAIIVGITVGISVIVIGLIVTIAVCFTLKKHKATTEYPISNECTTFVNSTSDTQDEPISVSDAPVLYDLSRHYQGDDHQAPVGHANVEHNQKHEPSRRSTQGYGSTQSGNYERIYRHKADSGIHDKLQHYVPVQRNLIQHHQGNDPQAPVGCENVKYNQKPEPSRSGAQGYGSTQSGNYEYIYHHMEDSGIHDKLQH